MTVLVLMILCLSVSVVLIEGTTQHVQTSLRTSTTTEITDDFPVSLICIYNGTNPLGTSQWFKNDVSVGRLKYTDTGCSGRLDLDNYSAVCTSREYFALTLISVTLDLHNTTWTCTQAGYTSDSIVLTIQVPVKNLSFGEEIFPTLTLRENVIKVISCVTSFSRPRATVTWYITETTGFSKIFLLESNSSYNYSTDFVSTVSTLGVTLNRTYNQWDLVCEAENIQGIGAVSKSLLLNITYPTNHPTIYCTNNGVYRVVQNTTGKLTCSVDGGNPAGTILWNCTGDITEYHGPNNNVTQTLAWTATQTQYCTCTATNIAGTRSTSVETEVLYQPVIDELQNKTVFEEDSVEVKCVVVRANPPVSVIGWTSNRLNIPGARLLISNVSRNDVGMYTCTANTTMDPSCQDIVHGSTNRSLHLNVLYPPSVNIPHGKSFIFKEGDKFSYTCPVEPGNPPSTNIMWRRSNGSSTWSSSELLIHNVTRHDDSVYTCYVSNVMVNSNGEIRTSNFSADIRLIVQFKTNVTDFYIRGYRHTSSITVMENTRLVFECHLQSYPTSDVRLYEAGVLVNRSRANEMLYYTRAACYGRPVKYSCHGNNSISKTPSVRHIQLFVNCTPRRDMHVDNLVAVGAINETVTLSYTALAYPLPSFTWYRNGTSIHSSDTRTHVSSADLQTNLTIIHVAESDFGKYTLTVANEVGSINELFYLKPQGIPEAPTPFTQDNTNTTDSIIALYWTSGFNNGLTQTFTIMYRQQPGGSWQSAVIPDRGPTGTTIHYTITGLSSDTRYEIVLYAVNDIGRSKYNATLTCKTKLAVQSLPSNSPNVSAIVGGTLSGVAALCILVSLIFIYRSRLVKDKQVSSTNQPSTYENLKIEQIPSSPLHCRRETTNNQPSEANVENTYEGLSRQDNDKETEYSQLGNTSNDDAKSTYENLKIQLSSCHISSCTATNI